MACIHETKPWQWLNTHIISKTIESMHKIKLFCILINDRVGTKEQATVTIDETKQASYSYPISANILPDPVKWTDSLNSNKQESCAKNVD